MLETLSPKEAFPALDLARLTIVHPEAACSNHRAYWTHVMSKALSLCKERHVASLEGPAAVAIPMLSLRLFANGFRGGGHPGSLDAAVSHLEAILKCTNQFIASTNKNVRLSVATVLYNVSCYLHSTKQVQNRPEIAAQVVASSDSILQLHRIYETEAITRALVALGTSVLASPEAKEVAKQLHSQSRVEMAASPHGDIAKAVAKEVYNALA
jgi:phospholipase A-2-activating protein